MDRMNQYAIILVDDDEDELEYMKAGMESSGHFKVLAEAKNGEELFEVIRQQPHVLPHLIISDLNMPRKDGYDVLREIKEHKEYAHIPVIILSNAPANIFEDRCKKMGACSYLKKPSTLLGYQDFAVQLFMSAKQCFQNVTLPGRSDG